MIELLGKILAMIKHTVAQILFCLDAGAEETDTPGETPQHDQQDNAYHGHTDFFHQEGHIKGHTVNKAGIDTVNDHLVQIGDHKL